MVGCVGGGLGGGGGGGLWRYVATSKIQIFAMLSGIIFPMLGSVGPLPVSDSVPARHISEGAAPCPYCLAPCPIIQRPVRIIYYKKKKKKLKNKIT